MAVREILSSAQGLFSSVRDGWSEASLVARTAAVATAVFIVTGTIYLVRLRPLPKKTVKVEPKVPKEKQEEDEGERKKPIHAEIVDGQMRIVSVDFKALGFDEDDSSSDDKDMEWVDCDGPCMEFPDFITEDPVQSSSLLPAMDDLFVRKEALAELEEQAGELISKLLGVVGGKTGNNPEPILAALSRLRKAVEPLIAGMIEQGISFDMSRFEAWIGYLIQILESSSEKPDIKINPQWAKRLDARLLRSLKQDSHFKLQYAWSGIIGAYWKTSVFSVRVRAIRLLVLTFVSSEKEAEKYLVKMAQRHTPLAELLTCNSEAVKEVFQELFNLGLCLFDAITNTLYDHSEHEIFNLFWVNRAELYEEAGEGEANLMTKILNQALAKANLIPLKEVLK